MKDLIKYLKRKNQSLISRSDDLGVETRELQKINLNNLHQYGDSSLALKTIINAMTIFIENPYPVI